jgi:aminomethyltransferase
MENKKTCLYDEHVALGAQMSPFGGFIMPIQYTSIIEEHNAVRNECGVFDVSHMGEVLISGTDAERFVNHIFTNDVTAMPIGKILYGMMCYEDGGVVDDLLVYKKADDRFLLVINAANIDKDIEWIEGHAKNFDVFVADQCDYYGQLAIQGPDSERVVEEVLEIPCKELSFYTFEEIIAYQGTSENIIVNRTGYTGEDGFEIYGMKSFIREMWDKLIKSGRCKPCGLGCRDTLRFEVGLPLYGDELSADISPIMAGLGIFVKLDKEEFIGKEALAIQKAEGTKMKLIGIELAGKAIPRHGYKVLCEGEEIGEVTTGYNSISTGKSVCMALVNTEHSKLGTEVEVQIRKKTFKGVIVKKRFYAKHSKK